VNRVVFVIVITVLSHRTDQLKRTTVTVMIVTPPHDPVRTTACVTMASGIFGTPSPPHAQPNVVTVVGVVRRLWPGASL